MLNLADDRVVTDAAGIPEGLLHIFIRFLSDIPS